MIAIRASWRRLPRHSQVGLHGRFGSLQAACKRRGQSGKAVDGMFSASIPIRLTVHDRAGDINDGKMLKVFGSPGRIRTSDQPVNSRLLYH
jgi:hypothetical protein